MLLMQLNADVMHDIVHGTPVGTDVTAIAINDTAFDDTTPRPARSRGFISHIRRHRACHRLAQGF